MAWTTAGHWTELLVDKSSGLPLVSGNYEVYNTDQTTRATVYTDKTKASTSPQPLTTNASGNASVFGDPGEYYIKVGTDFEPMTIQPHPDDLLALLSAVLNNQDNDLGNHVLQNVRQLEQTKTATYAPVATDTGTEIRMNLASAGTFGPLPNNLPIGWNVVVTQAGAGQVTFTTASGATLNNADGQIKTAKQYATCSLTVTSNSTGTNAVYRLDGYTA